VLLWPAADGLSGSIDPAVDGRDETLVLCAPTTPGVIRGAADETAAGAVLDAKGSWNRASPGAPCTFVPKVVELGGGEGGWTWPTNPYW
jgi:hypothetical protein